MTENFWKGDKVFNIKYGNGQVVGVSPCARLPIKVIFSGGYCSSFPIDGELIDKLYHGHDLEVTVHEQAPDRKKRVFFNIAGNFQEWDVYAYESLADARTAGRIIKCVAVGIEAEVNG